MSILTTSGQLPQASQVVLLASGCDEAEPTGVLAPADFGAAVGLV